MSQYLPVARTLFNLRDAGISTTLSGAGTTNGPRIDLREVTDAWLAVYVAGTSTGTSPTLDVQLDVQDADGNWFPQVCKTFQITASPNYTSVSAGLHMSGNAIVLPRWGRVTWILGGTNPVFPNASISLTGR